MESRSEEGEALAKLRSNLLEDIKLFLLKVCGSTCIDVFSEFF